MSTEGEPRPLRIGTAERTAAMQALDEHLAEGRLGVDEYGERSAVAANATTATELAALFTDLPAPHPPLPGVPALPPTAALPVVPEREERSGIAQWGPRIVAITPILAVALFLVTKQWYFFLLIPVVAVLLGSSGRGRR